MESLNGDAGFNTSYLLELASNNDLDSFRRVVEEGKFNVDVVGIWYCRSNGTSKMVLQHRTPVMVAALYGSIDVLSYILESYTFFGGDINKKHGTDETTALHCAAAGGSLFAVDAVSMLLDNGADLNVLDLQGKRPADVIAEFPGHLHLKLELEKILKAAKSSDDANKNMYKSLDSFSSMMSNNGVRRSLVFSSSTLSISLNSLDMASVKTSCEVAEKPKEYPVDPSIPDIKNSMYASDEFRMFSFKVRPCSRAYSHDWTECPFVHPGENARRRDPRRYHYSCVPCPDFRKGACRRGDVCEYAHGVFECWLHPAQYRTRLCKDGTGCTRRVCFFAHTTDELRPLYVSTGSVLPSPRTTTSVDMAALSPSLSPGSPSSVLLMSPFLSTNPSHPQATISTPPMSPPPCTTAHPTSWSQSNLQSSRLRASLSARDLSLDELERVLELDGRSVNDVTFLQPHTLSNQARLNAAVVASGCGIASSRRVTNYKSLGISMTPTDLDDSFLSDVMPSPRLKLHDSSLISPVESPMQLLKSSQTQQSSYESLIQGSHMSSCLGELSVDGKDMSMSCPFPSMIDTHAHSKQDTWTRGLEINGLSWSDWGSPTGKPEWSVHGGDLMKLRNSGLQKTQDSEVLLSQEQLNREVSDEGEADSTDNASANIPRDAVDHSVLGSWIDNIHLDQLVA